MLVRASTVALLIVPAVLATNAAYENLFKRQIDPSIIPKDCTSDCNTIVAASSCTPAPSCLCTDDNNKALVKCMDCIISTDPTGVAASAGKDLQTSVTAFQDTCKALGMPLSSLTISAAAGGGGPTGGPTGASPPSASAPRSTIGPGSGGQAASSSSSSSSSPAPTDKNDTAANDAMRVPFAGPLLALAGVIGGAFMIF